MTTRQWSIVAVLVFLNTFIFATLFLLLRQVYLTPTEVAVATPTPTRTPTFTPLSTYTPTPLLTSSPTNTRVVPPTTPTPTFTPTFTPAPPTPTFTPAPPTPTSPPPTATPVPPTPTNTPTFTPTPTPTPAYEFMYEQGSMQAAPNCGTVYIEGMVLDHGGGAMNGVTVRLQFFDNTAYRVSGVGQPQGIWGFAPLAIDMYHTPVTFYVQLVNSQSDPTPRSDLVTINFTDCDVAGQFINIKFRRQY